MVLISSFYKILTTSISHRTATAGFYLNLLLSVSFILFRKLPPLCTYSRNDEGDVCKFSWKESEILIFLLIVTTLKNRAAISMEQIVLNTLMFAKLANVVMFYKVDYRLAFIYSLLCVVRIWLFGDDFLEGNEVTTYFNAKTLEEELDEHPNVTWVVLFYTTWSPKCNQVFPVFAELSETYSKEYLKFGKLDIGKYPEAGLKYGVNASTTSLQLPTIIVFEQGKMSNWRPAIGPKKQLVKYVFSQDNIIRDFALAKLSQTAEDTAAKQKKRGNKDKKND